MRHVISQFADLNPPPALSGRLTSVQGVIGFVRTWYCCGAVDVARLLSIRTQETCSPDNRVSARIAALTTEKRPIELDVDVFVCVDKFTEISEIKQVGQIRAGAAGETPSYKVYAPSRTSCIPTPRLTRTEVIAEVEAKDNIEVSVSWGRTSMRRGLATGSYGV